MKMKTGGDEEINYSQVREERRGRRQTERERERGGGGVFHYLVLQKQNTVFSFPYCTFGLYS